MAALPPANMILLARFVGTIGGQPWNNIQHYRMGGSAPTAAQLNALAAQMGTNWGTWIGVLCANSIELTEVQLVDLTSNTSASGLATPGIVGTRTGNGFTAQIAMVVSLHGDLRYRGGHFRNYLPVGVFTDVESTTQWNETFRDLAESNFASFRNAQNGLVVAGAPITMVGLSYFSGHAMRPTPVPVVINSVSVGPRIDTQRRRLGKEHP